MTSSYRFSRPFVVRLLGVGLVAVALLVLLLVVLGAVLGGSGPGPDVLLLIAGVVLLVLLGAVATVGRTPVVRFEDAGYRVRLVRGAGVHQAEWKQVEDVRTAVVGGARCVVLRLRDGRTTTVPVSLLAARSEDFVDDLREHLERGHGLRRVRPAG